MSVKIAKYSFLITSDYIEEMFIKYSYILQKYTYLLDRLLDPYSTSQAIKLCREWLNDLSEEFISILLQDNYSATHSLDVIRNIDSTFGFGWSLHKTYIMRKES